MYANLSVIGLSNADIAERINLDFGGDLRCIFSSDNAEKPVLQIRMTNEDDSTRPDDGLDEEDLFLKKIEQNLLNQMHLRGIDGMFSSTLINDSNDVMCLF